METILVKAPQTVTRESALSCCTLLNRQSPRRARGMRSGEIGPRADAELKPFASTNAYCPFPVWKMKSGHLLITRVKTHGAIPACA